jgi:hypothetical protein
MLGFFYLKNNDSIFQASFSYSPLEHLIQNFELVVHFILRASLDHQCINVGVFISFTITESYGPPQESDRKGCGSYYSSI